MGVRKKPTYGSGSGSATLYGVEARYTCGTKLVAVDQQFLDGSVILDEHWQRIPMNAVKSNGVPVRLYGLGAEEAGARQDLFNYQAAITLAHLFLAQLDASIFVSSAGVEVRLVKVKVEHSYSTAEIGVGPIINRSDGPCPEWAFTPRESEPIPLSARAEAHVSVNVTERDADTQ